MPSAAASADPATPRPDEPRPARRFVLLTTLPMYVFRELAKSVGMALLVFSGLLLSVYMGQIFLRDDASVGLVLKIWPFLLPIISPVVLPFAIVTGVLVTYGRIVADREYLAAQAGGVHPLWLAAPAGVMATVAVFIVVFLNEFALDASARQIYARLVADQANILERRLQRPGSFTQKTGDAIVAICRLPAESRDEDGGAGRKDGPAGIVMVEFHEADPARAERETAGDPGARDFAWDARYPWPTKRVVARDHTIGQVTRDPETRDLVVKLDARHAVHYAFGDGRLVNAQELYTAEASLPRRFGRGGRLRVQQGDLDFVPMIALNAERLRLENVLADRRTRDPAAADTDAYRDLDHRLHQVIAALHGKIVLAFSCFCFAFVGVPMGLATGRKGTMVTNFMLGVAFAVAYALTLKVLEGQVAAGRLGWPALWLPNAALVALALMFVRRARRMAL